MNLSALQPMPVQRVFFELSQERHVPAKPGCYVLTSYAGEVIYVGRSLNLRRRFAEHRLTPGKRGDSTVATYWFFYADVTLPAHIEALERGWLTCVILAEGVLPPLNRIHS